MKIECEQKLGFLMLLKGKREREREVKKGCEWKGKFFQNTRKSTFLWDHSKLGFVFFIKKKKRVNNDEQRAKVIEAYVCTQTATAATFCRLFVLLRLHWNIDGQCELGNCSIAWFARIARIAWWNTKEREFCQWNRLPNNFHIEQLKV